MNKKMQLNAQITIENDDELVKKICQRDVSAYEVVYAKHVARALGLANHILHNESDAEDVIHDVFIDIWHKIDSYDAKRGSLIAWILLKVRSRCLDRLRKLETINKHQKAVTNENQDTTECDSLNEMSESQEQLQKSLGLLSTKQRNVIELSYFRGLTCKEISNYYDIPLGTVKTRLLSAVEKLRGYLAKKEVIAR